MNTEEYENMFAAFKTTIEMMEDREYFVPQNLKNLTREDFNEKYTQFKNDNALIFIFDHLHNQKKILVYFVNTPVQISVSDVTTFARIIRDKEVGNGVIISFKSLQTSAEKIIREINIDDNYNIEYFNIDELIVNISKHVLVPKHVNCSEEEKKKVLSYYRAKESQLPKILQTDPMARYLGARKGNLIKIERKSQTAGQYIMYRLVI